MFKKPNLGTDLLFGCFLVIVIELQPNMQTKGFAIAYNCVGLVLIIGGEFLKNILQNESN